jgi:hypothetical protein
LQQEESLRPELCAQCREIFHLCRRHDWRQIYCGDRCRTDGYRAAHRRANARHQASDEGRLDHRDHQREYRRRRRAGVTDIHPDEAKVVLDIFRMYAQGKGLKMICRTLNRREIPPSRQ